MTRSSYKWNDLPGNFEAVKEYAIFDSDNVLGIPTIQKDDYVPDWLVPYQKRIRTDKGLGGGAVHTFLDDYRFQNLWNRPFDTLSIIERIGAALSPDFSLFNNWPIAVQIWNVYRNRWLGAFWQTRDIKVIPTVSWSDYRSYDFCFLGVEEGSTVAISTMGVVRDKEASKLFVTGFEEMMNRIKPQLILCYGETTPINLEAYTRVKWFPTYWKSIRDARKEVT